MSNIENFELKDILKDTVLSSFDDKITLLKWLKDLENAIKSGNIYYLKTVSLVVTENNKLKVVIDFDGKIIESNEIDYEFIIDETPTEDSTNAVSSGGVYDAIAEVSNDITTVDGKIDNITPLDATPTEDSTKGVTSGGVYDAIKTVDDKIGAITPFDATPTEDSTKGVTSGGVYDAIASAGVNKKYLHRIYANIYDSLNNVVGYIYYEVVNTTNAAIYGSIFNTIHDITYHSYEIIATGYAHVSNKHYTITNFVKYSSTGYLKIEGIESNDHVTVLTMIDANTIENAVADKITITHDDVVTL